VAVADFALEYSHYYLLLLPFIGQNIKKLSQYPNIKRKQQIKLKNEKEVQSKKTNFAYMG